MVTKGLEAVKNLKEKGINARLIDMHTLKPIDEELILKSARETGAIVTAEEHSVYGGLGSAVAEIVSKKLPIPLEMVGLQDVFAESGDYENLLSKYGLSTQNIVSKAEMVIKRKLFI